MTMVEDMVALEDRVWRALVTGDGAADAALLAPGFVGVYPDGIAGAGDHAGQLDAGPTVARYRLSEARVLPVGAEHVMLIYRADYMRMGAAGEEAMYVSSLWRRQAQGWRNIFSQDTPVGPSVP